MRRRQAWAGALRPQPLRFAPCLRSHGAPSAFRKFLLRNALFSSRERTLIRRAVAAGFSLLPLLFLAAQPVQAARIGFTRVELTSPEEGVLDVVVGAEGTGVDVGCYFVRVATFPPDVSLAPELAEHEGMFYVWQKGAPKERQRQLLDNGPADQNDEEGLFSHRLKVKKWPPGHYVIEVGATNRPDPGEFVMAKRSFSVTLGEGTVINGLQPGGGKAVALVPSAKNGIIFKEEGIYACFPSLVTLSDGGFGVIFDGRTVHSHVVKGKGGRGYTFRSDDEGETWVETDRPLVDRQRFNQSGEAVTASAEGWLTVPESELAVLEAQGKILYKSAKTDQAGCIHYLGGAKSMTSRDGGATWESQPIPLPEGCRGIMSYLASASELVTSEGVRLVAVFGTRQPSPKDRLAMWEPYLLRSEDDGKSWTCLPMWKDGVADSALSLGEVAIAEAADGSLIAMSRNALPGGEPGEAAFLYQSRSTDGGQSWSEPEKTPMWGFPACVIRLKDGRMLCVYGYRRPPMGIRAVISNDNGKTWDMENALVLRADATGYPGDTGYPSARQLEDGSILVVYYITTQTHPRDTHIATTRFTIP